MRLYGRWKLRQGAAVLVTVALFLTNGSAQVSLPYVESFESGDGGFSFGGLIPTWAWGIPAGLDIAFAGDGRHAWVTELAGPYNNSEDSYLQSPVFDNRGSATDATLQFLYIHETEMWDDEVWVEVSYGGGPYVRLGTYNSPGSTNWYNTPRNHWSGSTAGEWKLARHPLAGTAGRTFQIRWRFLADNTIRYEGFGLDAVAVYTDLTDLSLKRITGPLSGAWLGASEVIELVLANEGMQAVQAIPITVDLTGPHGTSFTETLFYPLQPLESLTVRLRTTIDLSAPGEYELDARVAVPGDLNGSNDSRSTTLISQPTVAALPYVESFEVDDGGFIGGGTRSSWEVGSPSGARIITAASGARAWVTNLGGNHRPEEASYLQTPLLDCRGLTYDPFLRFRTHHELSMDDDLRVEVAYSGGPFTRLGEFGDPGANWYTTSSRHSFTGSSGGWVEKFHIVSGASGQFVQLRFVLRAVGANEGVGIDLVELYEASVGGGQAPTPGVAALEINQSVERLGFQMHTGFPGPYSTRVSTSRDLLSITVEGTPAHAVCLIGGNLGVGAAVLPGIGQIDIAAPLEIFGCGLFTSGLNPFFRTGPNGVMALGLSCPASLAGTKIAFQAAILDPRALGFVLSNAVQVSFEL